MPRRRTVDLTIPLCTLTFVMAILAIFMTGLAIDRIVFVRKLESIRAIDTEALMGGKKWNYRDGLKY